ADADQDKIVTLKEIDRYLEDRVSREVAPENQNPMTIGNKTEKMVDVYPALLEQLQKGQKGQMPVFTATESRGIEDDVLAAADSNIVELYTAFRKAIKDKQFLQPANACADYYYGILSREPQLERLHLSMRRNYAAALQDDAQQVVNLILKADRQLLEYSLQTREKEFGDFPKYLERAAELLGEGHYMYKQLQARKLYFEGYLLFHRTLFAGYNEEEGEEILALYRKALQIEPDLPFVYFEMCRTYAVKFHQLDSAGLYAEAAYARAPGWVTPYAQMGFYYGQYMQNPETYDKAEYYLGKAMEIDSNAYIVRIRRASLFYTMARWDEAETEYKKTLQIDSASFVPLLGLGGISLRKGQFEEAEKYFIKAIRLDSTYSFPYSNLGAIYLVTRRYGEAEAYLKKAIQLNPADANAYYNLTCLQALQSQPDKAFDYLEQALKLNYNEFDHMQKDTDLAPLREQTERWEALMKKYFPDKM
ncbi:MAG: tetratricopeptide repeat protein, partial [Bacteroidetes bacterium]